jgi:hypothetical protein
MFYGGWTEAGLWATELRDHRNEQREHVAAAVKIRIQTKYEPGHKNVSSVKYVRKNCVAIFKRLNFY